MNTPPFLPAHPLRARLNAWLLERMDAAMHRIYGARKQKLFSGLDGTLLEIGPGAGANFRYYPPGLRILAAEPNSLVYERLARKARQYGFEVELIQSGAEHLPLPDASVDVVVSSLVLCSVSDPQQVLHEIIRVLKPGGRFLFVEHIAAPEGSFLSAVQHLVRRPWKWLFEGCDVHRPTCELIRKSGFNRVDAEAFDVRTPLLPIWPHCSGTAHKI